MEKKTIEEIDDNSYFHFTHKSNYENIDNLGLSATIGCNAIGIEESPKVFFSKGKIGILKVSEVWLRWLMNRIFGEKNMIGIYDNLSSSDKEEEIFKWGTEFISGEYKDDNKKKEILFKYFFKYLEDRIYYKLDINEGIEFESSDIDENKNKIKIINRNSYRLFAKTMYGEFSDIDSLIMDDWNMHTKSNVGIEKNKLQQVITKDGKEDMLSIVIDVYDKYKDMPHKKMLLDDFIEYAKRKRLVNELVDEVKKENDQIDSSRVY